MKMEVQQMEPHTINHGAATVPGRRASGQKAWALPGGRYTTSRARAESVAARIDTLMRGNQ